jgi:4-carboxymuconolactone decarboxylase
MGGRIPDLKPEEMTERQKAVRADMAASFRGPVQGPFPIWLRNPDIGAHATEMVKLLRDKTSVPRPIRELAILVAARHHGAPYPWAIHAPLARAAGLPDDAIEAIRNHHRPSFAAPDLAAAYALLAELLETGGVGDATYAAAEAALGRAPLIDLVSVVTFYSGLAQFLNAFQVSAPDGAQQFPAR